ncbi:MAG: hypothetical protein QG570_461 [Patescibacteria group bacterium]|nr:hypothetical protein [Patescibacteria group bacterium]
MTTDSLLNTVYLTFAHNEYAIAFFLGTIISFFLLLYKPSRYATLLLIGFSTLLIGFEYQKHIMEPLQNQTLESLESDGGASTLTLVRIFQKLLPFGFFTIGWGSIFSSIFLREFLKVRTSTD